MSHPFNCTYDQYYNLLQLVMTNGEVQGNRTDQAARTLPFGHVFRFHMGDGFPVPVAKRLHFAGIRGEIIGFLRGLTNAEDFAALGCNWWRADANENKQWLASPHRKGDSDLGKVYGYQWRHWEAPDANYIGEIDQVQVALDTIRNNPTSRRIIINAWRPDHFEQMALPPCHVLYRFQVNMATGELNMSMYQRSSDMFLGVPMNIAGAALLLHMFAAATGYKPGWFTHHLDDTHVYDKADKACHELLRNHYTKEHFALPRLQINSALHGVDADGLAAIEPKDIELIGYQYHELESERVPMATTR